jgi:hypothetical protein
MSNARWEQFFQMMVGEDLYPKEMDVTEAYTLQFVNKRVGIERKR